ncbi:MAG: single-stranded DNA-binding protein [Tannerella sp.]|jgi:single-strand DNA-binding protein|nr:single-stranded DNA-binding protein [Tannerella sp.]
MSLNKVILIGNVGKDPVIRYFENGNAVANFSVATTDRGYTLANGTEVPERTEWHNIVASRDRVQFVEKYVKKGSLVYIEGKLRTRNYDSQDGVKHYVTEIHADRVEFYWSGRRPDSADNVNAPATTAAHAPAPAATATYAPAPAPPPTYQASMAEPPAISESADDLPF